MRARYSARHIRVIVGLVLALVPASARAQGFTQVAFSTVTADVTLTTTTETVIVTSGPATAPRQTVNVCILAWAQLTTGTATTTVTPRIQRGTAATGTVVGDSVAITVGAAAGSTEQYWAMACEDRVDVATVDYNLSLQQASATGDGTAVQAGILVLVR